MAPLANNEHKHKKLSHLKKLYFQVSELRQSEEEFSVSEGLLTFSFEEIMEIETVG